MCVCVAAIACSNPEREERVQEASTIQRTLDPRSESVQTRDIRTGQHLSGQEGERLPERGHMGGLFSQVVVWGSSSGWAVISLGGSSTWAGLAAFDLLAKRGSEASRLLSHLQRVACVDNEGKAFLLGR